MRLREIAIEYGIRQSKDSNTVHWHRVSYLLTNEVLKTISKLVGSMRAAMLGQDVASVFYSFAKTHKLVATEVSEIERDRKGRKRRTPYPNRYRRLYDIDLGIYEELAKMSIIDVRIPVMRRVPVHSLK
ncbi:MAG: hypothetical protein QXG97_00700 [Nitrososphaerota archaeon]